MFIKKWFILGLGLLIAIIVVFYYITLVHKPQANGYLDSPAELGNLYGFQSDYLNFNGTEKFYFSRVDVRYRVFLVCGTIDFETKKRIFAMNWDSAWDMASEDSKLPHLPPDMKEKIKWKIDNLGIMRLDDESEVVYGYPPLESVPGLVIPGIELSCPLRGVVHLRKYTNHLTLDYFIATTNSSIVMRIAYKPLMENK